MPAYTEALGLDITSQGVAVVRAQRRGPFLKLQTVGFLRLAGDEEAEGDVLRRFLESKGVAGRPCVAGLSGDALLLRLIQVEPDDPRGTREIVEEQEEHFEGVGGEGTVSTSRTLKKLGRRRRLLFSMTREESVRRALELPRNSRLKIVGLAPRPAAAFNAAALLLAGRDEAFATAWISEQYTEVIFGHGREPLFSRRFLVGHAELEQGGEDGSPETAFEEWYSELHACLTSFRTRYPARKFYPGRLVISGMSEFPRRWQQRISDGAELECTLFPKSWRAPGLKEPTRYAAAAGLALRGIGKAPLDLDFLPEPLREKINLQWQMKYWILSGLLAVLAAMIVITSEGNTVERLQSSLHRKQKRLEQFSQLEQEIKRYRQLNSRLQRRVKPLEIAVRNGRVLQAALAAVSGSKHENDWITLVSDLGSYRKARGVDEDDEAQDQDAELQENTEMGPRIRHLVVEGYTPVADLSTVRGMIEKLRSHPLVADVDLLPDDQVRESETREERWSFAEATLFALEIEMMQP
ncbi:hypothetical protein [Kiritimatiella glycovorans]|uniref:Type IV pilus assembly protein PilM n=1 Tax=Kiritimatiella glycovorans TaxID=1307763 RepID=A0A0G3EF19_9BACT|nr:hypothetical protein [Kiritimatiella glycovorans]AKJ64928.1 hypothetical protein L21SP4_01686 [Kiritimatiella glycovorans]